MIWNLKQYDNMSNMILSLEMHQHQIWRYLNSGCLVGYASALKLASGRMLQRNGMNQYVINSRLLGWVDSAGKWVTIDCPCLVKMLQCNPQAGREWRRTKEYAYGHWWPDCLAYLCLLVAPPIVFGMPLGALLLRDLLLCTEFSTYWLAW